MKERIKLIPVLTLMLEYFKEQPWKILLYSVISGAFFMFIKYQVFIFVDTPFQNSSSIILCYSFISGLILFLLFAFIRKFPLRVTILISILFLYAIGYENLSLIAFSPSQHTDYLLFYDLLFTLFRNQLPFMLSFYIMTRLCLTCIQGERITLQKVFYYDTAFLKILGILLLYKGFSTYLIPFFFHVMDYSNFRIAIYILYMVLFCRFLFAPFLIVDRNLPILKSVLVSWKITRGYTLFFFLIYFFYLVIYVFFRLELYFMGAYFDHLFLLLLIIKPVLFMFFTLLYRLLSNQYFEDMETEETIQFKGEPA